MPRGYWRVHELQAHQLRICLCAVQCIRPRSLHFCEVSYMKEEMQNKQDQWENIVSNISSFNRIESIRMITTIAGKIDFDLSNTLFHQSGV